MAESTISPAQQAARRRALGRRLAQKASQISVDVEGLRGSPDLQYLDARELKALEKLFKYLEAVSANFNKLSDKLEASK